MKDILLQIWMNGSAITTCWNVKANPGNFKCDSSFIASSNSSF